MVNVVEVNDKNGRSGNLPTEVVFNGEAGQKVLNWWVGMEKDGLFLDCVHCLYMMGYQHTLA